MTNLCVSYFTADLKIITRIDDSVKEGYIVWSDNCRIPNISVYDKSIKHLIKKLKLPKCSKLPLTSVVLDVNTWSYSFKINHASLDSKMSKSIITCCYSSIIRDALKFKKHPKDDDRYK